MAAGPLGTKLAIGLNTTFWNGRPSPMMTESLEALYARNKTLLALSVTSKDNSPQRVVRCWHRRALALSAANQLHSHVR